MLTIRTAAAALSIAFASTAVAAPAHAQLAGGSAPSRQASTHIVGNVDVNGTSTAQIALVIGDGSTGRADQCTTFEDTYVGGNLNLRCKSTAQIALVIGDGSTGSATQASVGAPKR